MAFVTSSNQLLEGVPRLYLQLVRFLLLQKKTINKSRLSESNNNDCLVICIVFHLKYKPYGRVNFILNNTNEFSF